MRGLQYFKSAMIGGASALALAHPVTAKQYDVPDGDLAAALSRYIQQGGIQIYYSDNVVRGHKSRGAKGEYTETAALTQILRGTGFVAQTMATDAVGIVPKPLQQVAQATGPKRPPAPAGGGTIETVTVTAEKMSEDIQTVPIAVTAVTQKEMTINQIAGGPDLIKSVPNLTFSKTNFSGYNLEIRGIGTQAISVTTDPAVAVALNGIPFIRNHFFEQEFYDLSSAEILRGPQGTLYGRNATAGVVNVLSAKPTDEFAAMASVDFGNFNNRRYEAMVNMPIVDDRLDIRVAGEWTKRDGYSTNTDNNAAIDGRDLWSSRVTIGWKPTSDIQTYLVWEHFSEDDNRMRTAKQLCQTDPGLSSIDGVPVPAPGNTGSNTFALTSATFSQGCLPASLYSKNSFEVPNGFSLPFISGAGFEGILNQNIDPYASVTQSTNLRNIQSAINPTYRAKNDTLEFNAEWTVDPSLTVTSQTGFNNDFLWSSEDYNRFDTSPGIFIYNANPPTVNGNAISPTGVFCDPQLGCSNRLVVQDLSTEHAWQFSQEARLASSYTGPFNFSVGGNYLHYETEENYYVFANTFTMISLNNVGCGKFLYVPNVTNNLYCLPNGRAYTSFANGGSVPTESPQYLDPNPITSLNNEGHNYFVSQNPYVLNSYAIFGEAYYNIADDLKLISGLRWTDDQKHFVDIPSQLLTAGYGYPSSGVVNQSWSELTGRLAANWSPKLDFTDQSMFYASYAHGYKAGGANPPGAVLLVYNFTTNFPIHPLTFKPEYIDAFELGTKNTLLDDTMTLNADIFYYKYRNYQISQIVDRSAINLNFDASVKGAELESTWEPLPGLRFTFAGGYETSSLANGSQAIDLVDRTAGNPNWVVMKPWVGQSSNCVFPTYVAAAILQQFSGGGEGNPGAQACGAAYVDQLDPVTLLPYVANPTVDKSGNPVPVGYPGFNPATAPNNGEGFAKNLSDNQLPNAPHFTASFTAQYTMPVSANWAATLHGDFYWQANSWARVENDRPYDVIHGYSTTNLALILNDTTGWQIQAYVKNLFNVTAITGDFLNSDDSGLTTNVFLTDPRLFGIRVTKQLEGADVADEGLDFLPAFFTDADGGRPPLWIELGGQMSVLNDGLLPYDPPFVPLIPNTLPSQLTPQKPPAIGLDYEAKVSFQPQAADWVLSAGIRYGRSSSNRHIHKSLPPSKFKGASYHGYYTPKTFVAYWNNFSDEETANRESHLVVDFTAGKDVGLGMFGMTGTSVVSGGVRIAQFTSSSLAQLNVDPDYHFVALDKYHDVYSGTSKANRSFHGIGPTISWDGSTPILGSIPSGELDLDWGANAAVLFGRQRMREHHQTSKEHCGAGTLATCAAVYTHSGSVSRSRTVTVPNLGGFGGISVRYLNAKVSFGYRADEFFGAMDGGQGVGKSFNRGFFGPFANISIGLGG